MTSKRKDEIPPPADSAPAAAASAAPPDAGDSPALGFPIVGIGASAGGVAAFEAFFSGMPAGADPGMAFVLVQHLSPDHKSILSELIRRYTRMQVFEVEDGMPVHPNCAYIIPPGRDMAFLGGTLQLLEPTAPRGQRMPIDFFFRSLAQDQHERAIGIVLSGTGSDGTLGVRAIKGEGGMVTAQTPESTEYDGMPRSAIATGLVDYVLRPAEMPAQLLAYVTHAFGRPPRPAPVPLSKAESALKKIFIVLRAQTGHDFSQYKLSTVQRRIERRMAVQQIDTIDNYVHYLQHTPAEAEALFRDLLIGVTSFFRDPDSFHALDALVVVQICASKPTDGVIRVWAPGCATGEEAYSLAILLAERQQALKRSFKVLIFATDIDSQAIALARAGSYPASIAADVSPERLARFFAVESDGAYRVRKNIRDMLVFSEQDVIKDPPFSRLDLISCRNLLIYMGGELQRKLIPLFHYALNPGGYLFLGASETIGEHGDLFATLERKWKVYQRKPDAQGMPRLALSAALMPPAAEARARPPAGGRAAAGKLSLRELTEQAVLQQVAPVAALVNGNGDIYYLHGRTGLYLEPTPGDVGVNNILKMAREGLRRDLATALHKASAGQAVVRSLGLRVKTNGDYVAVDLTVLPVADGPVAGGDALLYLVILQQRPDDLRSAQPPALAATDAAGGAETADGVETPDRADAAVGAAATARLRVAALQQELQAKDEYIQTTVEELETTNEEIKSANEEMQSVNEELQSTNEELETSKEELQSVNEELATVNAELQAKVADLSRANNDMNNLLAGTGIATVFVDHSLRIMRFTPAATRIINLIQNDIGRPVGHIVSNLVGYDRLLMDVKGVLDTLIPRELEVQTKTGAWYTMRIQPYRTLDNMIEGAVLTFVDVSLIKQTQEALLRSESLLRATLRLSQAGGWEWDVKKQTMFWTDETYRLHDLDPTEFAPGTPDHITRSLECYRPADRPVIHAAFQQCVEKGQPYDLELPFTTVKGRQLRIRTRAEPAWENGQVVRVIGTLVDVTDHPPRGRADSRPETTPAADPGA